ncbi:MAG: hypothetical protein JSV18_03830 [Candidatus Bathyarchaeota archaeon]|nr:MAG: hypothetical protein JSV18_03830 [Candidatus Bathyarchaeota archaeon]
MKIEMCWQSYIRRFKPSRKGKFDAREDDLRAKELVDLLNIEEEQLPDIMR